ncbi:MAG: HD domain-containing protein [Syntrophomonadaceae bacterium]|nr:HD domain-containing protein [Syntrophomonadaceae bacterium]
MQDILLLLHSRLPSGCVDKMYLVGGFIRDTILGYEPSDLDLVVEGGAGEAALQIASLLSGRMFEPDPSRAIYRVVADIARIDLEEAGRDGLRGNLQRRDFTIDALALPLADCLKPDWQRYILDPCKGLDDLRQKTVRAVSPTVMQDDPLRCLRAFRLAGKLDLTIDSGTLNLIREAGQLMVTVAPERIWEELAGILSQDRAAGLLRLMDSETGLLEAIIPEIIPLKGLQQGGFHHEDTWNHSLNVLESLESIVNTPGIAPQISDYLQAGTGGNRTRLIILKLAAILHDIGKPCCQKPKEGGGYSFHGHDRVGKQIAVGISRRLRVSSKEAELLRLLVREHMSPLALYTISSSPSSRALRRLFLRSGQDTIGLLLLALADYMATRRGNPEAINAYREFICRILTAFLTRGEEYIKKTALLNGHEIQELLGLKPSPLVGEALQALADAKFDGLITTREDAVAFLRRWAAHSAGPYREE